MYKSENNKFHILRMLIWYSTSTVNGSIFQSKISGVARNEKLLRQ